MAVALVEEQAYCSQTAHLRLANVGKMLFARCKIHRHDVFERTVCSSARCWADVRQKSGVRWNAYILPMHWLPRRLPSIWPMSCRSFKDILPMHLFTCISPTFSHLISAHEPTFTRFNYDLLGAPHLSEESTLTSQGTADFRLQLRN